MEGKHAEFELHCNLFCRSLLAAISGQRHPPAERRLGKTGSLGYA
jgi:hypothetical protein